MRSIPHRNFKRTGFSLLELLICIVIIVILGSTLNPVLTGAKEQANMNKCSGHIRQLSIALTSYAANNDDVLPKVDEESTWMKAIEGDVKKLTEIFKCPSEPNKARRDSKDFESIDCTSYGLNLEVVGSGAAALPGVLLSNIEQPSQTIILSELSASNNNCYCAPKSAKVDNVKKQHIEIDFTRHGGSKQSIYLFADGHTKAHTYAQVFPDGSYENSLFNPERP